MKRNVCIWVLVCIFMLGATIWLHTRNGDTKTEIYQTKEFPDELMEYIFDLRLENAYIVYSQAVLETGTFTSDIFFENNNLFGMKMPERRATTAIGINRGHATYKNWRSSVDDYALMQMAYYKGLSETEYLEKLGRIYATDPNYMVRLIEILNSVR